MSSNTRPDRPGPDEDPFVVPVAPGVLAAVAPAVSGNQRIRWFPKCNGNQPDARVSGKGGQRPPGPSKTGVPLELWLSQLGHATRADRRMLLKVATTLVDMPATFTAFRAGQITWSQTRAIVDAAARLRKDERVELDTALVDDLAWARNEEPDEITWRVVLFAAELEACRIEQSEAGPDPAVNRTMMQPRLDGTGGKLWADLDALGFAIADQALATRMARPHGLAADPANGPDPDARAANRDAISRSRGDALVDIFRDSLAGHGGHDSGPDNAADREVKPAQPLVLATTTLDDLMGLSHGSGELLTTLTGGRLRITNAALRRLVDEGGASLRLIVTEDTGRAVGVGRKTRVPPGWLREASLALHPECLEPNCRRSARQCDLDHAIPWDAGGSDRPPPTAGSRSVLGAAPRKPTSSVVSVALRKPPSDEGFREGPSRPSGRRARSPTRP